MNNYKNKAGWITGGGAGIGASLCKVLTECGVNVLCTDIDLEVAERVTSEIRAAGGVCIGMNVDITKQEENNATAVERTVEEWGSLHMVGINAAVDFAFGKDMTACTLDETRRTTEVNYFGSFLGVKHAAIAMKERNVQGNILVIGLELA